MSTSRAPSARVLIIEDDQTLSSVVARHLQARGHEACVAASAEEAAELLRSGYRPSIVVLDINLPGDTGWSLLREGRFAEAGSPPVVVVTATHVPPSRLHEFAIAGYLPKPFALETLIEIVEREGGGQEPAGSNLLADGALDAR